MMNRDHNHKQALYMTHFISVAGTRILITAVFCLDL